MNFIILGNVSYSTRRIKEELKTLGHTVRILNPAKFAVYISEVRRRDRVYFDGDRVYRTAVDCLIPRIGQNLNFGTAIVDQLSGNLGIPTTATAGGLLNASNKLKCLQLLSQAGILVPRTLYLKNADYDFSVDALGELPWVGKLLAGSQGAGVFILETEMSAKTALDMFAKLKKPYLLQSFVKTAEDDEPACDIRAIVVGGEVVAAYKRFSTTDDFRSNYSISKLGEKYELSDRQKEIAVEAAKACGLDCAGVDLAENIDTGETICHEVNGNFSLSGVEAVTDKNVAGAIAKRAAEIAKPAPGRKEEKSLLESVADVPGISFKNIYNMPPVDKGLFIRFAPGAGANHISNTIERVSKKMDFESRKLDNDQTLISPITERAMMKFT